MLAARLAASYRGERASPLATNFRRSCVRIILSCRKPVCLNNKLMASDLIETGAILKGVRDTRRNNSSIDVVTPSRTRDLGNGQKTSSPSSSGVSRGARGELESNDLRAATASSGNNGEEGFQGGLTKARGSLQGGMSSTPVSLQQLHSPGHAGRSVCWSWADMFNSANAVCSLRHHHTVVFLVI